ncbi:nitric oxide-sensing protein NosP [Granulosicoccaceae sp. 1_MG-2023]|nr:nitric oxide-sensing protein NosP [Granulosicoccaceae sp. 1_MG-2023]
MLDVNRREQSGVISVATHATDPQEAASDLHNALHHADVGAVLFFCSPDYDLPALAREIETVFPDIPVAGCTTSGELTPDGYAQGCVTAIGFNRHQYAVSTGLIQRLDQFDLLQAQSLIDRLLTDCRSQAVAPIRGNTFAMTLLDGLSALEEQVLVSINSVLGSIPNFGGSAGDNEHLSNTHVYYRGQFYTDAAVLVLINTRCPFEVFSTVHMKPKQDKLVVTRADDQQRIVYELNAEPAAIAYARAVGVATEDLDSAAFALNPIAVRIGDEYYVRSIQQVDMSDYSLRFYCAVEQGIVLTTMEAQNMQDDLERRIARINRRIGRTQLIIGCDCFLRRLEAEKLGFQDAMSETLRRHHVIGFNTYGEQIGGMYINQTFTGVVIGVDRHAD